MQKKEFRLSQLEISDFFIGWSELAATQLSPLVPKYQKLKRQLDLMKCDTPIKAKRTRLARAQILMREITMKKIESRNYEQVTQQMPRMNKLVRSKTQKCKEQYSKLFSTLGSIKTKLGHLKQDNQQLESFKDRINRNFGGSRSASPCQKALRYYHSSKNLRDRAKSFRITNSKGKKRMSSSNLFNYKCLENEGNKEKDRRYTLKEDKQIYKTISQVSTQSEQDHTFNRCVKYRGQHLSTSNLKLMAPVLDISRNSSHLSIPKPEALLGRKHLALTPHKQSNPLLSAKVLDSNLRHSMKGLGKKQLRVMKLRLKSQTVCSK